MNPIPQNELPQSASIFAFQEEPLISVSEYFNGAVIVEPKYFLAAIPGATEKCMLRKSVVHRLEKALSYLDKRYTFKIYDAWRPIEVQQFLFDKYYREIASAHADWPEDMIIAAAKNFVSLPSYEPERPSVHNTGGAVDLTIVDRATGKELDMGTGFDDFTEMAHTVYFENGRDDVIRDNRRTLYWSMTQAGFTNYPAEWWHYDYGDAFWSYYTKNAVKYKGMIEEVKNEKG